MRYLADTALFNHAVITTSTTSVTVRSYIGAPVITTTLDSVAVEPTSDPETAARHTSAQSNRQTPLKVVRDFYSMGRSPAVCLDPLAPTNVQFFRLVKRRAIRRGCLRPPRPGTTSLVVVIAYDRRLGSRSPAVNLKNAILDDAVQELAVVFRPAVGGEKPKRSLQTMSTLGMPSTVFEHIPRLLGLNMNGRRKITVVGLEKVPSNWMGHSHGLSPAALLSRTTAEIEGVAIRASRSGRTSNVTDTRCPTTRSARARSCSSS
ncbi:uncharacterized protein LOC62_05G006825 [Vanrija pseudolonga]|uniref:Uncharacterized protein n=1 Tax=Vanrija pseudolonga TaxID=143232 RepID=A0AAF0YEY6_9TREE|nr:hypothetical protein LOC62_05G006825 [Vanrija pseudolonga]